MIKMRVLYFDCFSGISGDMTVGALLDLGVPQDYLIANLNKLGISDEYELEIKRGVKCGIEGTDFNVHLTRLKDHDLSENHHFIQQKHDHEHEHEHEHNHEHEHERNHEHEHEHDHENIIINFQDEHHGRNFFVIEGLIDKTDLNDNVKKLSKDIFMKVAEAESKVHGKSIYEVHFHEVGAVDSIVDIIGTAICIDYLQPDLIISSPINTGSGFVKCEHGLIPVPAPATVNILKDVPIYCDEREFELTTPTGAAIIKVLASEFKKIPLIKTKKVGYGCGKRNTEKPNLLRVILAEDETDEVCILEATIDDMNPQLYGYFMDKLFAAGAKDVYLTPVYMKKNRPGIVVTITASNSMENEIKQIIFNETTTIGIRRFNIERTELQREFRELSTEYGDIMYKISMYNNKIVNISPEFEDLKRAAESYNVPLKKVFNEAVGVMRSLF
jgi:pyridinium-3,5-bisthiocarboxylic acid mononucleotide nickel chelatase